MVVDHELPEGSNTSGSQWLFFMRHDTFSVEGVVFVITIQWLCERSWVGESLKCYDPVLGCDGLGSDWKASKDGWEDGVVEVV